MKMNEILAKNIITRSNLPDADYVINPYTGCSHACIYCYARFMKRFSRHEEKWGSFVDVKINAPDLIPQKSSKYSHKSIFISSVTDPYLPLERKYQLTRRILERLVDLNPVINIQTKSDLITRDIDILKRFERGMAGLTLTTLDDQIRKEVEPCTASVERRIEALKQLKSNGIKTYVFVGPIFPGLTDWKGIISATKAFADYYMFENLNAFGSIEADIQVWIGSKHPGLLPLYKDIYQFKSNYWTGIEEEIRTYCEREKVDYKIYFHHGKAKKS